MTQNGLVGVDLPEIQRSEFLARLRACSPEPLVESQLEKLYLHYSELCHWNRRVSLVGSVQADFVVERHYGESLAALPLLKKRQGALVDLGSGAGFPGFVLAVARPEIEVVLIEARGRKWSFLKSVCRAASLSSKCLNARVGNSPVEGLPQQIDWITSRAVRVEDLGLSVLLPRLVAEGSLLYWAGAEDPILPDSLTLSRAAKLAGSERRRILEIQRVQGDSANS